MDMTAESRMVVSPVVGDILKRIEEILSSSADQALTRASMRAIKGITSSLPRRDGEEATLASLAPVLLSTIRKGIALQDSMTVLPVFV